MVAGMDGSGSRRKTMVAAATLKEQLRSRTKTYGPG